MLTGGKYDDAAVAVFCCYRSPFSVGLHVDAAIAVVDPAKWLLAAAVAIVPAVWLLILLCGYFCCCC